MHNPPKKHLPQPAMTAAYLRPPSNNPTNICAVLASAMLIAALLVLGTKAKADSSHSNTLVAQRIALMNGQKRALEELTAMTRDYIAFDRASARAAKRILVRSAGRIPRRFRRDVTDLSSHARGGIWVNWEDFSRHADSAKKAARALNVRSAAGLRRSLPRLISSCHNCHQIYRLAPREFTTH
ncbi:c-type cytochrome [Phaeobacter sp. C3_T13_0]|uniref:c-type cytochrome n=1 Tax=Phaeobacter cretensis TaxID=3342641 RepID=UPI0039BCB920